MIPRCVLALGERARTPPSSRRSGKPPLLTGALCLTSLDTEIDGRCDDHASCQNRSACRHSAQRSVKPRPKQIDSQSKNEGCAAPSGKPSDGPYPAPKPSDARVHSGSRTACGSGFGFATRYPCNDYPPAQRREQRDGFPRQNVGRLAGKKLSRSSPMVSAQRINQARNPPTRWHKIIPSYRLARRNSTDDRLYPLAKEYADHPQHRENVKRVQHLKPPTRPRGLDAINLPARSIGQSAHQPRNPLQEANRCDCLG